MVGLNHDECEAVRAYVESLPAVFRECASDFIQMGLTAAEVEVFVSTARRSGDQWWKDGEDQEHVAEIDANIGGAFSGAGLNQKTKHVTTIRVALTEEEKNALRVEYSGVTDLKFESDFIGRRADHAFSNATRTISKVQLRRLLPTGCDITEVGAKVEDAIMSGPSEGLYYGVMPVLDASDVNRHSASVHRVRALLRRQGRTALKPAQRRVAEIFLNDFDRMFTRERIQDVVRRTDVVLSQDANYDIPMEDCVKFMHRNGTKAWLGSMVRCEQACVFFGSARGRLPMMGFEFHADAEADTVSFNFRTSAFGYKHRLSIFAPYQMCDGREFRVGGETFVYRVLQQTTKSQLYFGFFRVPSKTYTLNPRVYCPNDLAGMLRVTHAAADLHKRGKSLEERSFLIDQETFSRVLRDRLATVTDSDEEAIRSIRMSRVAVVVNGVRISVDKPIAFDLVKSLASVTRVVAEDMKAAGKFLDEDVRRSLASGGYSHCGVMSALWESTVRAVTSPGSLVAMVKDRLKVVKSNVPRFSVEAEATFREGVSRDVIFLDGEKVFEPTKCFCVELRDAEAMRAGECGGLTADETSLLDEYIGSLRKLRCVQCEADTDIFFDVEESIDVKSDKACDSGYESKSQSDDDIIELASQDSHDQYCREYEGQQTYDAAEGVVRDAMQEHTDILRMQMTASRSEAEVYAKTLLRAGVSGEVLRQAEDPRLTHEVVNVTCGFVTGSVTGIGDPQRFHQCYDFERKTWIDVEHLPNGQAYVGNAASDKLYTNSAFEIWNQPVLIQKYERVLADYTVGPLMEKFTFINGIYGCGKTREIIDKFKAGDVYVTATARSAVRVRESLFQSSKAGRSNVFTFDAAMMHWSERIRERASENVETLYFDEACMTHVAQLLYLIHVMRPVRVEAYGDFHQITWKAFVNGIKPIYAFPKEVVDMQYRIVSHRCRLSVVAATLDFYGWESGITCCNCCPNVLETEEALECVSISSLNQVPIEKGVKYLTFTHADEKKMVTRMAEAGIVPTALDGHDSTTVVSTVHSIQGETFEKVVIVRGTRQNRPGSLFFQADYVNTALSRSKTTVKYYTVSGEKDLIVKSITNGNSERYREVIRRNRAQLSAN